MQRQGGQDCLPPQPSDFPLLAVHHDIDWPQQPNPHDSPPPFATPPRYTCRGGLRIDTSQGRGFQRGHAETAAKSAIFTIFERTSEIQRMLIRAATATEAKLINSCSRRRRSPNVPFRRD